MRTWDSVGTLLLSWIFPITLLTALECALCPLLEHKRRGLVQGVHLRPGMRVILQQLLQFTINQPDLRWLLSRSVLDLRHLN